MSFKARLLYLMMKHRHLLKGHLHQEVIDKNTSIEEQRRQCDESAERLCKPLEGVKYTAADYSGCYAEWVEPENAPANQVVLYFHGGGFVMGNARSHRNIVGGFMKRLGMKALVLDYRLAPEYPAPAAVNFNKETGFLIVKLKGTPIVEVAA